MHKVFGDLTSSYIDLKLKAYPIIQTADDNPTLEKYEIQLSLYTAWTSPLTAILI